MNLLVIRHGKAADKSQGGSDASRPLTRDGIEKMEKGANGLKLLVPTIFKIASSPLIRAKETANIVSTIYGGLDGEILEELIPGSNSNDILKWMRDFPRDKTVAVVGHEPSLGSLISFCLTGVEADFIELKKGGAALVEFNSEIKPSGGRLLWLLQNKILRSISS